MGRKIPGAKHHGIKDPIKQQEQRMKKLKSKINAPPSQPDEQPIPKSLTRLFEFKEQQEQRLKAKKNKNKNVPVVQKREEERSDNPMSSLSRLPGESSRSFNLRINNALHSINKRHLQTHEMERSLNPDQYLAEDDAKEERFDFIQRKKLKRKLKEEKKRKAEDGEAPSKLSRMQRWTIKKKDKKAEKLEEKEERFEPRYERVQFGEVAHEPPSLHVKPRRAQTQDGAARPGRRELLLNKIFNHRTESPQSEKMEAKITVNMKPTSLDKKAKRKSLPVGVRMRLEQSQKEAIDAYRALKANFVKAKK